MRIGLIATSTRAVVPAAAFLVGAVALVAFASPALAQPRPDLLKDGCVLKLPGMDKVTVRLAADAQNRTATQ